MVTTESLGERKQTVQGSCLASVMSRLATYLTVTVVALTIAGFAARLSWRCEQVCHFRLQYFWLLAVASLILLVLKQWRWGSFAAIVAAVNVVLVIPIYWPTDKDLRGGQTLSLVSYNVLSSNRRHADVCEFLRSEDADVVLLMEVDPQWAAQIETLRDVYTHHYIVARDDNFGIALLSQRPWREIETRTFGDAGLPTIIARYDLGSSPLTLIGSHPLPPGNAQMAALRNQQLFELAEFAKRQHGRVVVAGDLNVTSYSPFFRDLLRDATLRDSRQGLGVQATWSPKLLSVLDIPIDHCLISPGIGVVQRRVGPRLGSDHRPVIVRLKPD